MSALLVILSAVSAALSVLCLVLRLVFDRLLSAGPGHEGARERENAEWLRLTVMAAALSAGFLTLALLS